MARKHYQQQENQSAVANLEKIQNLISSGKDVLQLTMAIKEDHPELNVSVFNASDPDVTLGNNVGEYTNTISTTTTTEENYTGIDTNGLCFERITNIHNHSERIIQCT